MSNTTPSPPPSAGPNLTHHPYSIATGLNAVGILCTVLTTCTTAIRFYTKLYIIKAHGWEDYTMFIAWGGFVAYISLCHTNIIRYGAGTHQWDVPVTKIPEFAKSQDLESDTTRPLPQLSGLHFCERYLQRDVRYSNVAIPTLMYLEFTHVFQKKLEVSAVFLVGNLALAASILRFVFSAINKGSHDATFDLTRVGVCTAGELAAGILVGNLVVFPRFFSTCSSKFTTTRYFSSYHRSSGKSSDQQQQQRHDDYDDDDNAILPSRKSWSGTCNAQPSSSSSSAPPPPPPPWLDQHDAASRLPGGEYVKLRDRGGGAAKPLMLFLPPLPETDKPPQAPQKL